MTLSNPTTPPVWTHNFRFPVRKLRSPLTAEVVVVGSGVAGLSAAYMLAKDGYQIVVLDKPSPLHGMTARSTAHISTAIDGGWRTALSHLGLEKARVVADAYRQGIHTIERIIADEQIACDFARVDGYLSGTRNDQTTLLAEFEAADTVGLSVAWSDISPLAHHDAVHTLKFNHQARLHPVKYAEGLARALYAAGVEFIGAEMLQFTPGEQVVVQTSTGVDITAVRALVIAINGLMPLPGVADKQNKIRSYVIGARIPPTSAQDAIAWDLECPYHYTRTHPTHDTSNALLLVGGEGHPADQAVNEDLRFQRLETWARNAYPNIEEVCARWSGDLQRTTDNLGLLGRHDSYVNVFIIDGDGGLGFNHATIGAHIVRSQLANEHCAWTSVFKPTRLAIN